MYNEFYGLNLLPFNNTPDPRFFFSTPDHEEALASLVYAARARKGFVLVTGEVGSGKTLLTRLVSRQLIDHADIAALTNTNLDGRDLLVAICQQFGVRHDPGHGVAELSGFLEGFLVDQYRRGRLPVVVIDEAQNLSIESFEQLRMISNLEAEDAKLIQIMILGQPELRQTFQQPELEQLRQRIYRAFHLGGFTLPQTVDYIHHRLRVAGAARSEDIFTEEAMDRIHEHSKGIPRVINQLCDNALLSGFAQARECITLDIVEEVIAEMLNLAYQPGPEALSCQTQPSAGNDAAQDTVGRFGQQALAARKVHQELGAIVEKAQGLIHRFEEICSALPKDIERLEQVHNQVTDTCGDAREMETRLSEQGNRAAKLTEIFRHLLSKVDDRIGELRQATSEAAPLFQALPEETNRLAGMMRAQKAAIEQLPTFSKGIQQLVRAGQGQAQRLQTMIEQARHAEHDENRQTSPARAGRRTALVREAEALLTGPAEATSRS